ncbi:MAG: pilus assembly protein TadG-related protein [Gemmatimonadota bacterium]|jgi:hypothetical protein
MSGSTPRSLILDREGQALPIVIVFLAALLSLGALAFDLGMLVAARSEAQRAADAIALAGASVFIGSSSSSLAADAKARAREEAAGSHVLDVLLDTATVSESADAWQSPEVTVEVVADSMEVRAVVRRTGVAFWLGRIFGEGASTVTKVAAVRVAEPAANNCTIPLAIPVDPDARMELGQLMVLRAADSSTVAGIDPFFAPFAAEEDADATAKDGCAAVSPGDQMTIIPAAPDGPTSRTLRARLFQDPNVRWDGRDGHLWRGRKRLEDYVSTPRVVKVPTFDRSELTDSGQRTFTVTGFAYFFLQSGPEAVSTTDQLEITGRFLFHAPGEAGSTNPYARALRLAR